MPRIVKWVGLGLIAFIALGAIVSVTTKKPHAAAAAGAVHKTAPAPIKEKPVSSASTQPIKAKSVPSRPAPKPCAKITRSPHTSCPFALAVIKAYDANPATTVTAYSSVTHRTYSMQCKQLQGVAVCAGGTGAEVAFSGPPIPGERLPTETAAAPTTPPVSSGSGGPCDGNPCIGDWQKEAAEGGTVVQCADGTWSHAGGISGACSDHGGEA